MYISCIPPIDYHFTRYILKSKPGLIPKKKKGRIHRPFSNLISEELFFGSIKTVDEEPFDEHRGQGKRRDKNIAPRDDVALIERAEEVGIAEVDIAKVMEN